MSINLSTQKASDTANEFTRSSSTLSNSHSSQSIPKIPNKFKRSSSSSKINNSLSENSSNFAKSQLSADESLQISFLKKNFDMRISKLYDNLQSCVSKITNSNARALINEEIFYEKERFISDLCEQNSIIKTEYEEIKVENQRFQKIISALDQDCNQYESKLKKQIETNKKLNSDISKFQVENFELNLKIKNLLSEKDAQKTLDQSDAQLSLLQKENSQLKDQINKLKLDYENHFNYLIQKQKNEVDGLVKEKELQEKNFLEVKSQLEKLNCFNLQKDTSLKEQEKLNYELSTENNKLSDEKKFYIQFIILLQAKLSSFKTEMTQLKKLASDEIANIQTEYQNVISSVLLKIKEYEEKNSPEEMENKIKAIYENHLLEQFSMIEKTQKENKRLLTTQEEYLNEIKILTMKNENLEIDNKSLSTMISKLKIQNDYLNSEKKQRETRELRVSKETKMAISKEIKKIKQKYKEEIESMKDSLTEFVYSFSNYLNRTSETEQMESNNENNQKIILQLQEKIEELKANQEDYARLLTKKDKKINELQSALSQSFNSISTGMKNIKIANLLDNEVKMFLKKTKSDYVPNKFNK